MNDNDIIQNSIASIPSVEGPVPVTEESHPFCAMRFARMPTDPSTYNFEELEYFLIGTVNIYGVDAEDRPVIKKTGVPYKNRILVRRPKDIAKFSGRVYVDIMNATQGYDIEDLWHRCWEWCVQNNHGYVGITSKPVNVASLKSFDYPRYWSLNWADGGNVPQPAVLRYATIPGTEEGMVWDMISQTGSLIRRGGKLNCFDGAHVDYVYLTGQSQSGAYLNTYIHYFDALLPDAQEKKIFDGYLNIVGAELRRSICQDVDIKPLTFFPGPQRPSRRPFISITSEGDVPLFQKFFNVLPLSGGIKNSDTSENKRRHYELAGAPHTDTNCPLLSSFEEVEKTGRKPPPRDILVKMSDFPAEYYIAGLLEKLHIWAEKGIAPEISAAFERCGDGRELLRDEHGNVRGGLRSPFVDVPAASYTGCHPDDPEGISGKIEYFSRAKFKSLYGSFSAYLGYFSEYAKKQCAEGWITESSVQKMIDWAHGVEKKLT
jgi:hypothetical protein